jgi:hypothetical protein
MQPLPFFCLSPGEYFVVRKLTAVHRIDGLWTADWAQRRSPVETFLASGHPKSKIRKCFHAGIPQNLCCCALWSTCARTSLTQRWNARRTLFLNRRWVREWLRIGLPLILRGVVWPQRHDWRHYKPIRRWKQQGRKCATVSWKSRTAKSHNDPC